MYRITFLFLLLSFAHSQSLEHVADDFRQPLGITHANDGSQRLFVVEKGGRIKIFHDGKVLARPFLDISRRIASNSERGLLSLAFHPNYSENGYFYVNYSNRAGDTVIARFQVGKNAHQANARSEKKLLTIAQPYANHNGGQLQFGPDGYLYIGTGDGGAAGDPKDNGQDRTTLLGAILRIDVDAGEPYAIPTSNPFVAERDVRPEIWAYGLRNPWRFSFDRATGDVFIADVGQNAYEEVNYQAAQSAGGENYGWNSMEGLHCYLENCDQVGLTLPILEYDHSQGLSITGGYVYRGDAVPSLYGAYIYGDFVSGKIWRAFPDEAGQWQAELVLDSTLNISSFGEDEAGELYVVDFSGGIYRFIASP